MTNHVVLFEPQIPANTGNIARTCAATNSPLHLIKPLGFSIDDKHLKRAGLDYWNEVEIYTHENLEAFLEFVGHRKLYLITKFAEKTYSDVDYTADEDVFFIFGKETTGLPEEFKMVGRGYMMGIPIPVVVMLICYIVGFFVLKYTKFGRSIYAIGGNLEAARLSGIPVSVNKVLIHTICGLTAGIAGVVLAARLFSGQPSAGNGMELDAIAAAVIGGTSTSGGKGRLWGTLLGALIMGIITNGMNLMNISTNWQYIMQGTIIIVAVGLDRIKNND